MPEVILPCPACGSDIIEIDWDNGVYCMKCQRCSVGGPCFSDDDPIEAAIAAWNALPRSLPWTTEPPKVAGKYWWRPVGKKIGRIREVYSRNGNLGYIDSNDFFVTCLTVGEWAGPIAPPIG